MSCEGERDSGKDADDRDAENGDYVMERSESERGGRGRYGRDERRVRAE